MINSGKLSVIVPAYNADLYLKNCIESILKQSYTNFEVIIVDDGSKDNTLQVAQSLANEDERIVVIHQDNKGLPAARNTGLRNMTGRYVFFLDSDDWLESNCFERIIKEQEKYSADIVFFSYFREYSDKKMEYHAYNRITEYKKVIDSDLDLYNMKTITAWGKLYTVECINGILYDEKMRTAEDVDFNYRVYSNVHRAVYVPECLLHYRILPKSAIHGYDSEIECKFEYPIKQIGKYMKGKNKSLNEAYYSFVAIAYIVVAQNGIVLNNQLSDFQKLKLIKELNKKDWVQKLFENIEHVQIPWSRKAVVLCGKYNFNYGILTAVKIKKKMEE